MSVTGLGHFTIRCTEAMLAPLRAFYQEVLGLRDGPRPDFPFPGNWFYCGEAPIVHLAAVEESDASPRTGAFDHIAFSAEDLHGTRERMRAAGVPFFERPIPGYPLQQLFTRDPSGIKVEQTFSIATIADQDGTHAHVNGTRLAVEVSGNGPALLLLHGGAGSLRMFDRFAEELSTQFRVIRYDQRDCGRSDTTTAAYDFNTLADDAVAVLEAMDAPRAHVFGTSFGGLLAQAIARRHPRHVASLVLSSTWLLGKPFSEINPDRAARGTASRNAADLARDFFSPRFNECHPDAAIFFEGSESGMSLARANLLRQVDPQPRGVITSKTLVLGGADDRIVPFERTRDLARNIDNAVLAEPMTGVGHVGVIEAPLRVAELVRTFCS